MCVPTFKECKKILEDFYKKRIKYNIDSIFISQLGAEINIYESRNCIYFKTFVRFKRIRFSKYNFFKHIKPIIFYAYSYTSYRKHIKDDFILKHLPDSIDFYYEKDDNNYYIRNLKITLTTSYNFTHMDYDFYIYALSELENKGELRISHTEPTLEEEEPTPEKPKVINLFKIFKCDDCIICMVNKPNILFCNCGHLCECEGCYKIKTPSICPVCKTDNEIIRNIE